MADHPPEGDLALYVTGDLEHSRLALTGQHAEHCAMCRERLEEFEHLHCLLESFPAEPEPPDLLAVRTGVIRALENGRRRHRVEWAVVAAAGAALLLFTFPEKRLLAPRAPAVHVQHSGEARSRPSAPVRAVPVIRRQRRTPRPRLVTAALLSQPGNAPVIRMTTSNPNVVILLPPDSQSDERMPNE